MMSYTVEHQHRRQTNLAILPRHLSEKIKHIIITVMLNIVLIQVPSVWLSFGLWYQLFR